MKCKHFFCLFSICIAVFHLMWTLMSVKLQNDNHDGIPSSNGIQRRSKLLTKIKMPTATVTYLRNVPLLPTYVMYHCYLLT